MQFIEIQVDSPTPSVLIKGVIFAISPQLKEMEYKLVSRAIALLGLKQGNEKEINALAWEIASQAMIRPDKNGKEQFKKFTESLNEFSETELQYLIPNYCVNLRTDIRKIIIAQLKWYELRI